MKIKTQSNISLSRVIESTPSTTGSPSMTHILQLWKDGRFPKTDFGKSTFFPIQRMRLIKDPAKGFRLAEESEMEEIIDTEKLTKTELQHLYSILMEEGNVDLADKIRDKIMTKTEMPSERSDISELLHQNRILEDIEKKGGKLDIGDQESLGQIMVLLDKTQRVINTNIKDPDVVLLRDILVPLRRRCLALSRSSENSQTTPPDNEQPDFDISVEEEQIQAYRRGVKKMGSYGSMGEGECIANGFKMQVPVFEVVDGYYVLVHTWGTHIGGLPTAWGVVHLGNHYVAVQNAVSGQAVDRRAWVNTAPSGDCLFEAMLVIAQAIGKIPNGNMRNRIQQLREKVASAMPSEAIVENIQEMILFGNIGKADPKIVTFVNNRRKQAFSKYHIRRMTKEKLDTLLLERGKPERLVVKATQFLQAKASGKPIEELISLSQELIEEIRACPVKNLGYNEQEVSLFLVKAGGLVKDIVIHRKNPQTETIMMYHITSFQNLLLIQQKGLDPAYGAGSGGSCAIGGNEQLQKSSRENTKGKIAAGTSNSVVATYIHQRIAWAELVKELPVANFEIQLRFSSKVAKDWTEDPDNPKGGWHTKTKVPPENIEALLFDGWHPIQELDIEGLLEKPLIPDFDADKIYMAYTLNGLVAKIVETSPLLEMVRKKASAADLLDKLEEIKSRMQGNNIQIVGTSAHPIREPQEWLFVIYTTDPTLVDPKAQRKYIKKIGTPGWNSQK